MVIWLALLIPVITAVVLYVRFRHETLWWEFLIPFGVSILLIALCKFTIETAQTRDTEYWGGWVSKGEYYEDWNERVSCRHPRSCSHRDSEGNRRHSNDGYQHSYDVDYHPPYWQVTDSNGIAVSVNSIEFDKLSARFQNRKLVDMHRSFHTDDGDCYVTDWNQSDATLVPFTSTHSYENRVAVSDSVFNFPEVDPKTYGLFEYPDIAGYYDCPSILGAGDVSQPDAQRALSVANAKLGRPKQVRMMILVFKNQPIQAGFDQQSYWKGGNKNEFVVTVGVDDSNSVQWCHVFSWSDSEQLKIETRDYVVNQKTLNLAGVVNWMVPQINAGFVRKEFRQFSYISIDPPGWAVFLTFLVVGMINTGVSWWVIVNEFKEFPSWRGLRLT